MIDPDTNAAIACTIGRGPALSSLLRQLNLLPAALEIDGDEWKVMSLIVCAFKLGQDSVLEDERKGN